MKSAAPDWARGACACALMGSSLIAVQIALAVGKGEPVPWQYGAVAAALQVGAGGVVGGVVAGLARRVRGGSELACLLWLGVEASQRLPMNSLVVVGSIVVAAGCARYLEADRQPLWSFGFRCGLALGVAFGWWPIASSPLFRSPSWVAASSVLVFAALLGAFIAAGRWFPASPRRDLGLAAVVLLSCSASMAGAKWILRDGARPGVAAPQESQQHRPNLIVMVLDTVSAQHMSVYGYGRDTTPKLAAFLRENEHGRAYGQTYSPSNWTLPSHVSLLTGQIPSSHGVHYGTGIDLRRAATVSWRFPDLPNLAEILGEAGYRSRAVVANPYLTRVQGLSRGFEQFELLEAPQALIGSGDRLRRWLLPQAFDEIGAYHASAEFVADRVLDMMGDCQEGGCFLLANFMDAHAPYQPKFPYRGRFGAVSDPSVEKADLREGPARLAEARDRYDEMIAQLDEQIGRTLDQLRRRGLLDRSWVVVTSDHGESFGEHGAGQHGSSLYNDQVRIPLIVIPPRAESLAATDEPVSLLDLTATLSAIGTGRILGTGRDLRDPVQWASHRPVQAEFFGRSMPGDEARAGLLTSRPGRAVVVGGWKLIDHRTQPELYRLTADPEEKHDQSELAPERVARMASLLPPLEAGEVVPSEAPISDRVKEQLRVLGYLGPAEK